MSWLQKPPATSPGHSDALWLPWRAEQSSDSELEQAAVPAQGPVGKASLANPCCQSMPDLPIWRRRHCYVRWAAQQVLMYLHPPSTSVNSSFQLRKPRAWQAPSSSTLKPSEVKKCREPHTPSNPQPFLLPPVLGEKRVCSREKLGSGGEVLPRLLLQHSQGQYKTRRKE